MAEEEERLAELAGNDVQAKIKDNTSSDAVNSTQQSEFDRFLESQRSREPDVEDSDDDDGDDDDDDDDDRENFSKEDLRIKDVKNAANSDARKPG